MSLNTGIVKWFNVKSGYGFITLLGGDSSRVGSDVFVHHGSLVTKENYYRYLVQGEYVDFEIVKLSEGPHEFHATNVSGVMAGPLMCETLADTGRQIRAFNPTKQHTDKTTTQKPKPRSKEQSKEQPLAKPKLNQKQQKQERRQLAQQSQEQQERTHQAQEQSEGEWSKVVKKSMRR